MRQWIDKDQSIGSFVYCYDIENNTYLKSSSDGKELIGLNDKLFQGDKIYTQDMETYFNLNFENNYNSNIIPISHFIVELQNLKIDEDILDNRNLRNKYNELIIMILNNLMVTCLSQWVRHPGGEDESNSRYVLFSLVKKLFLYDDTSFQDLFAYTRIGNVFKKIKNDPLNYWYGINFLDKDKLKIKNFIISDYTILIEYTNNDAFFTSTYPIIPLFKENEAEPYGIIWSLTPSVLLKITPKIVKNFPMISFNEANEEDVFRLNMSIALYGISSEIVFSNKMKIDEFCTKLEMLKSKFVKCREEVLNKFSELKELYSNDVLVLDADYMENVLREENDCNI